jgi:hypothetical protein
MSIAASNPGPLLGRDAEVELLASLLDGIQGRRPPIATGTRA